MKKSYNLSNLDWMLSGWIPWLWRLQQTMEIGAATDAEISPVPAKVPGSVQYSLKEAGLLPDWNIGVNYRECEWVENKQWIYELAIPDNMIKPNKQYRLKCLGLDYKGFITLNGNQIAEFCGTHTPYTFNLTPHLEAERNILRIIFDLPPRWLGQIGYTSQVKEWKTRFNYTWDWIPRLVQIGIWDDIFIEEIEGIEIENVSCVSDADYENSTGILKLSGRVSPSASTVCAELSKDGTLIKEEKISAIQFNAVGFNWVNFPVELWWPNLEGDQPLYDLTLSVYDDDNELHDTAAKRIGFRNVSWQPCKNAPANADPWLCVVNGKPVFLQGVNFPPVLPNYADVTEEDYSKRISLYKSLGVNIFRINGVGFLEKEICYNLCDEAGIFIWQDIPLSSSGINNVAPDDDNSVNALAQIAESFAIRRQHHPSLLLWCGGNELQIVNDEGVGIPLTLDHPMIKRLSETFLKVDPSRRFLETTSSGPRFYAQPEDFGKGLHWDVHGPWKAAGSLQEWNHYWSQDDALFRSETGAPGAASVDLIRKYKGNLPELPVEVGNPLWRRPVAWWIEPEQFRAEHDGKDPNTLEEYVAWSQKRQADLLQTAVKSCKDRFPECGGIMLWTGHDCYPCAGNTSIIDFHGDPKPAAIELSKIWLSKK